MKRTFTGISLVAAAALSLTAFAQTTTAAARPASGGAASTPSPTVAGPTKVGIINIQQAIVTSNEGRRDFETLSKKYEPKQAELQKANQKLEDDKKQLSTQGDKMNDDARSKLSKQIEQEQRELQHSFEAAQADFQGEQNDLANKIGQKMMKTLDKYAKENGFSLVLDVSSPQSPVLWANLPAVDLTDAVVSAYNVESGVPAPPAAPAGTKPATGVAPRPAVPRPATTTPKPATPPPGR